MTSSWNQKFAHSFSIVQINIAIALGRQMIIAASNQFCHIVVQSSIEREHWSWVRQKLVDNLDVLAASCSVLCCNWLCWQFVSANGQLGQGEVVCLAAHGSCGYSHGVLWVHSTETLLCQLISGSNVRVPSISSFDSLMFLRKGSKRILSVNFVRIRFSSAVLRTTSCSRHHFIRSIVTVIRSPLQEKEDLGANFCR